MSYTSERLNNIPFSSIRRIFEEAGMMEKSGISITHMEIGRPDFDTPLHIKQAAVQALMDGKVHYTSNSGIAELRTAISEKLSNDNGITVDPETEVVVTIGCKEAIVSAVFAFINPGDEVLIPDPSWLEYQYIVELAGGIPIPVPLLEEEQFILQPDRLKNLITPKTKMLLLNSPHNPTGSVLPLNILQEISLLAIQHDLIVLSDEIYEKMIYDKEKHVSIASLPDMFHRTVVINGFSKAYAMDGWRLGYAAGPEKLIKPILKFHQYNTTSANSFAQYGAAAAYSGPQHIIDHMVIEFDQRRQLIVDRLNELPGVSLTAPKGAFYVFPSFKAYEIPSAELAEIILKKAHIACVPGSAFGTQGEGYIRMAYSTSFEEISKAMDRLSKLLNELHAGVK